MKRTAIIILFPLFIVNLISAQTNEITYQGRLVAGGAAANTAHDFEFRLCSTVAEDCTMPPPDGGLLGTLMRPGVTVSNGIFTVELDFDAAHFNGADRWLQIAVRPAGGSTFTTLVPRQPVASAPYSIKSLNSATAITATNATQLGGVAAGQYVVTTDPRMSDARTPLPGSNNYIQNQNSSPQESSGFNISGTGTAEVFNAGTQFNFGGARILGVGPGANNLFAGVGAGGANASGEGNSLFGAGAGQANTDGSFNAFFGRNAGRNNQTGSLNAFFGTNAGQANTSGGDNAFFGTNAGANTTGSRNSFFGRSSGQANMGGSDNVFLGMFAGNANGTGNNNTIIGTSADLGANNLNFATAIGAGASVGTDNTVVLGRSVDAVQVPGNLNVSGILTGNGAVPAGAVMFFSLASCPSGWSELQEARGRYLVGLPLSGMLNATQGIALSNLENRPTGQHDHPIDSHAHTYVRNVLQNVTPQLPGSSPERVSPFTESVTTSIASPPVRNSTGAGGVVGTNAPYLQLLVCKKE